MPSFEEKVAKPSVATRYQAQQENNAPLGPIVQRKKESRVLPIQAKLEIGQPNDKYEQEADRVADKVVSMPGAASVAADNHHSISNVVQHKTDTGATGSTDKDLEHKLNSTSGSGSQLDPNVRSYMEPRIGADFSNVKVHTGSDAVQMNQDLGSHAFAHNNNIYFNQGEYQPGSDSGKKLIAHELTHVVQQHGGGGKVMKQDKEDKGKQRAETAHDKVKTDTRLYGQNMDDRVDCSKAAKEISNTVKDGAFKNMVYDEKFSKSLAANMAKHLNDHGAFTMDIKQVKIGDFIFWTGEKDAVLKNIDHVGVITKIDEKGVITVASAEVNKAKYNKETKKWEGGAHSFNEAKLAEDGTIWRKHDGTGGKIFVGAGRPE